MNYNLGPRKGTAAAAGDKVNDPTVVSRDGDVMLKNKTRANFRTYVAIGML